MTTKAHNEIGPVLTQGVFLANNVVSLVYIVAHQGRSPLSGYTPDW